MVDPHAQRVSLARREGLTEFRNSKIDSRTESGAIAGPPFLLQNIGDCLGGSEQYCSPSGACDAEPLPISVREFFLG